MLGIDFHKALAKLNIAPAIILLRLNRRCDHRIDSNDRYDKQRTAGAERFISRAEKRALLVDRVPQSQRRGENRQPSEMEFENIKVPEISAFEQRCMARRHDSKLGLHHASLDFVVE